MGSMSTPGDLLNAALKALSQPPPPPPNAVPPAPPNMGADPNTGAPQPSPTPGPPPQPGAIQPNIAGPAAQPVAPPAPPTKAHKLLQILQGGLQGAMAGRAASEQAVVDSGGRRSGGAGMGFTAGYNLPWQHAMQQQQLQQAQAQTALTQSQSQLIDTPMGKMPPGLAKVIFPSLIGAQSKQTVQGMKGDTAESIQGQKGQTATDVANIKAGTQRYKPIPGVGMFDTQTRQVMPGTANGITITPEIAKDHNLPDEFIGKPMKLTDLSGLQRSENQQETTVQGAAGPALVNKKTGNTRSLGLGSPGVAARQAGPVQAAADPNNPGNLTYMTAGQAMKTGAAAPGSAPVAAAKSTLKSATSGDIAKQSTAFQTAMQHADLLKTALTALGNGDQQTINSLKNKFSKEFGGKEVTNFQTISQVYSDEVQKMISSGHITEGEQKLVQGNLPSNASPQQILGALDAYKSLAQSKMNILQQQTKQGMQGKPNFPGGAPPTTGALTAADMLKKYPPK
jgi:hypothetical protein